MRVEIFRNSHYNLLAAKYNYYPDPVTSVVIPDQEGKKEMLDLLAGPRARSVETK